MSDEDKHALAEAYSRVMRRPGRPKEFDGTPVSVRLPRHLHDSLSVEACRRRVELSQVIRERLSRKSPSSVSQK